MSDLPPSAPPHPPRAAAPSRRSVLIGAGVVGVGAAGGVVAGLVPHRSDDRPPPHPEVLLAAVRAERRLLAGIAAAVRGRTAPAAVLSQLRADHAAHLAALTASVAVDTGDASTSPAPSPPPPASPPDAKQLRSAETAAAVEAARRALLLTGRDAAVLASIAACEASHAELLG